MVIYSLQVNQDPMEEFGDNAIWGLYKTKEGATNEMERHILEHGREKFPHELQEWGDEGGYNCILSIYDPNDQDYEVVEYTILSCRVIE